jgi:hypothetical protein
MLLGALAARAETAPRQPSAGKPGKLGKEVLRDDFGLIAGWERQGVILSQSLPWESSLVQDPCLVYGQGGGPLLETNALNQPSVVYQGGVWHMTYGARSLTVSGGSSPACSRR